VDHELPEDFAAFYAAARDGCVRAVGAAIGDPALAEDLVAEAFARAFAQWARLRRHPSPRAWVVRVALNAHVSWWRKRRREVAWRSAEPGHERAADGSAEPLDDAIMAALRALPRRQREVIALRVFLDLDTHYTAEALGIAPSTVAEHLNRATAALRTALAPRLDREPAAP
jgi:RNA polymerase sigma-70 factor (sigma-E family)